MYYRVYTLKHCENILLHSYINDYTKCLIVMVTTFIEFSDHYTGQPKCPIGNGSNSNYHNFSTSNIIFTKRFKNFLKY